MLAFQFPTQVTHDGALVLPRHYLRAIPAGSVLQVVLLVEPPAISAAEGVEQSMESTDPTLSLEAYTAYLRRRPLPEPLTTQASGLLGVHLASPVHRVAPDFDETAWNAEWDQLEATWNTEEWTDEQSRLRAIQEDLHA